MVWAAGKVVATLICSSLMKVGMLSAFIGVQEHKPDLTLLRLTYLSFWCHFPIVSLHTVSSGGCLFGKYISAILCLFVPMDFVGLSSSISSNYLLLFISQCCFACSNYTSIISALSFNFGSLLYGFRSNVAFFWESVSDSTERLKFSASRIPTGNYYIFTYI